MKVNRKDGSWRFQPVAVSNLQLHSIPLCESVNPVPDSNELYCDQFQYFHKTDSS